MTIVTIDVIISLKDNDPLIFWIKNSMIWPQPMISVQKLWTRTMDWILNYDILWWKQEGLLPAKRGHLTSTIHHHPMGSGRDPFES